MFAVALLVLALGVLCAAVDVETEFGPIQGHELPVYDMEGELVANINSFLGVPFARDTSGDNRFRVKNVYVCNI